MQLSVEQLHYTYQEAGREHVVLEDVSFELARGERVALLGSSGSGKSTMLNLIGGIDAPDRGTVRIGGQDITDLQEPALTEFRCRHIGLVYQQFNLIPTLTAAENILLPLELLGFPREEQRRRLHRWLEAVGLAGRDSAFPDQLSGGEQQRVSIVRALIHEPAVVLADEPTGNLDAHTGRQVLALLFDLAAAPDRTLLIVTHSQAVAQQADRTLTLERGKVQQGQSSLAW
jgi:putative ABC transport system ATP-binding protein